MWTPFRRRWERAARRMATEMVTAPQAQFFGLELCRAADISPADMYLALSRWEQAGWLTSGWEDVTVRRPRRFYLLTDTGRRELAAIAAGGTL